MSPPTRSSRTGSNRQADSVPPAPPRSRSSIPEGRNDSGIDPDTRRAPSVVSGPREVVAVGPAPVVETPSAAPQSRADPKLQRLETRIDIANAAHVELLQEVTTLRLKVEDAQVRGVADDLRTLRRDVNSLLESFGTPGVFTQEYRSLVEEHRVQAERFRARLDTLEAIIHMDGDTEASKDKPDVSEDEEHRSAKRDRHKSKKRVHLQEDLSDSDPNRSSSSSSSKSSDSEDGRRSSRATRSKATYTSQGAIRTRKK
ncbi:unnamed protein product, partial [Agarophyton chilense]